MYLTTPSKYTKQKQPEGEKQTTADTAGDFNIPLPGTELVYSQQGYGRTEQHQQPTRLNCNQEYAIQRRIHAFQVHTGRQSPR